MPESLKAPGVLSGDPSRAQDLKEAFAVFNQVSAELTQAYGELQAKVASLTSELAVANGELRRQYEEKEALSERLTLLLNALPAGVVALEYDGTISELNPAAASMLGQSTLGESWEAAVASRLAPAEAQDEWWLSAGSDRAAGPKRVHIAETRLASGQVRILLLHDVTAAHEMKARLERSHRLAAMGEMAASLAHQLRTPLSAALLYSANLGKPGLSDEARARFAHRATDQLRRLERLIHDVLLFARGEEIGRESIRLDEFLAEVEQSVEPVFREREVSLLHQFAGGDLLLMGSRKPLGGALVSLLENALQVSPSGGQVTLGTSFVQGMARISVRDEGPGIPPDLVDRVFEPFFTTRAQGTGLGLAIALGVAKAHGGTIEVLTHGNGTEFVLVVPAAERPEHASGISSDREKGE